MRSMVSFTARSLPGIGSGREDDGVAVVQLHVGVIAVGHAPQRRQRLALAAGRDHDQLVVGEVLDLLGPDEHPLGHVDVAQHAPDVHVLAHRASHQRHLASQQATRRRPPAARGGCSTRSRSRLSVPDSARTPPRASGPRSTPTARCPARSALVESPHSSSSPSSAQLGQPRDVGRHAVDRSLVELVVAGDERRAQVAGERDARSIGDRVGHLHHLDREGTGLEGLRRRARPRPTRPAGLCSSSLERTIATVSGPP